MNRIKKASELITHSGPCSPHTFKNKTIILCSKFYVDGKKNFRDGETNFKMVTFSSFKLIWNKIYIDSKVL